MAGSCTAAWFTSEINGAIAIAAGRGLSAATQKTRAQAVATALGTDTRTHTNVIETAPIALSPGQPPDHFTGRLNMIVNIALAGNLSTAAQKTALDAIIATMP